MKSKILALALLATINLQAITVGEVPKEVTISGEDGGLVKDSAPWSSSIIKDNVYVVFYVDPDEKDVNDHFTQELKKKHYSEKGDYETMAIINLAATWKPNFVIEKILAGKQEEFPNTLYVKDKKSVLVKEWGLEDDASDVLIFGKDGRLLFYKSGKMQEDDMNKAYKIIESNL